METADPTRKQAVLCWTTEFFGNVAELQTVDNYGELWKEHVPTLTHICRRKGMLTKTTAQSPLDAFESAKTALKNLNDDRLGNGRYAELNPSAAAAGDETEIYKVVVLLLSAVSIYAAEYLEDEDSIELMQKKNLVKVFANVLELVNNPGTEWWQGGADSFDDSISDPCFTTSSQDESFTNFEIPAVPSTPRSAIRRNTFVAPHSPIHSAVNSPMTMKKRQDEMRKRMTEMADQVDFLQKQLHDSQDQERVLKNSLAEIKEKWREADEECRRQTANYVDTEEQLRDVEKKYADLVKDAKELQTRGTRYKGDLETAETAKRSLAEQVEALKTAKEAAVGQLRDVTDEFGELQKKYGGLEQTVAALQRQLETTTSDLEQHETERQQMTSMCQQKIKEADDKCNEVLARESDLRAALHGAQRTSEDLQLRLSEEKEERERMFAVREEASRQEKTLWAEKLARLQTEATTAETALAKERETSLDYKQQFLEAAHEAKEQNAKVVELQARLEQALQDEEKIKEIRGLENSLETLKRELDSRTDEFEKQLAEQRQVADGLQAAIEKKDKEIAEKTAELRDQTKQIHSLSAERDELRRVEVRLKDAEVDLRSKIALIEQLEDNTERLKGSCDLLKTVVDDRERQFASERASHAQTRTDLEQALMTNDTLTEKNKRVMEEHETRVGWIEAEFGALARTLAETQAQLEEARTSAEEAKTRAAEAESRAEALRLKEDAKLDVVPAEEEVVCESYTGSHDETLQSELDATVVVNSTFSNNVTDLGEDLSHLDAIADDDDETVFHLKSIDGSSYEQVANASTSRDIDYKVDRDRIEELKRRNAQQPAALRSSYHPETWDFSSPNSSQNPMKTPSVKSLSLSTGSQETPRSIAADNKENVTLMASAKKTRPPFARRVSNIFTSKPNK